MDLNAVDIISQRTACAVAPTIIDPKSALLVQQPRITAEINCQRLICATVQAVLLPTIKHMVGQWSFLRAFLAEIARTRPQHVANAPQRTRVPFVHHQQPQFIGRADLRKWPAVDALKIIHIYINCAAHIVLHKIQRLLKLVSDDFFLKSAA